MIWNQPSKILQETDPESAINNDITCLASWQRAGEIMEANVVCVAPSILIKIKNMLSEESMGNVNLLCHLTGFCIYCFLL